MHFYILKYMKFKKMTTEEHIKKPSPALSTSEAYIQISVVPLQ